MADTSAWVGGTIVAAAIASLTSFVLPSPVAARTRAGDSDVGEVAVELVEVGRINEDPLLAVSVEARCANPEQLPEQLEADLLVRTRDGRVRVADREIGDFETLSIDGRAGDEPSLFTGTVSARFYVLDVFQPRTDSLTYSPCDVRGGWRATVTRARTGRIIRGGPVLRVKGPDTAPVEVAGTTTTLDVLAGAGKHHPVVAHTELDRTRFRWTVDAPSYADGIAAGDDSLWVVSTDGDKITQLRERDGKELSKRAVPNSYDCCAVLSPPVVVTPEAVFTAGGDFPVILRDPQDADATTFADLLPEEFDGPISALEVHGDDLYAVVGNGLLARVDARTGTILATRTLGNAVDDSDLEEAALDSDGSLLFVMFTVTNAQGEPETVVERLDPLTVAPVARTVLPAPADQLAAAPPGFWVSTTHGVVAYDAATLTAVTTVPVHGALTTAGGTAWLFDSDLGVLIELVTKRRPLSSDAGSS